MSLKNLSARQLQEAAGAFSQEAKDVIDELCRRYRDSQRKLTAALKQNKAQVERSIIDRTNLIQEICCVLVEDADEWDVDDIIDMICEKSGVVYRSRQGGAL